jgi:DNA-binding PadR family transcriptional regulator
MPKIHPILRSLQKRGHIDGTAGNFSITAQGKATLRAFQPGIPKQELGPMQAHFLGRVKNNEFKSRAQPKTPSGRRNRRLVGVQ